MVIFRHDMRISHSKARTTRDFKIAKSAAKSQLMIASMVTLKSSRFGFLLTDVLQLQ